MIIQIGDNLKLAEVQMTSNKIFMLENYIGQYLVLYFYPKDSTPVCTTESVGFADHFEDFAKVNVQIFGVSKDSLSSHQKFKARYNLPFELIADTEKVLCNMFGVLKEKSMFGKKYMGVVRSTFVIDPSNKLIKAWYEVKVQGHVKEVLTFISSL